jgi:hypothetical protein
MPPKRKRNGAAAAIIVSVFSSSPPPVSVAVVCSTGARYLARCLDALRAQRDAPRFDVPVVCDPAIDGIEEVTRAHAGVRVVRNVGQRTPLELVSRALRETRGVIVLVTKDVCRPDRHWVRALVDARRDGRAVVGGRVEPCPDSSATGWAFHFIDFFRYAGDVREGPAESVTVCNASYWRPELEAVAAVWQDGFVETAVNAALSARFGTLWLEPAAIVTLCRDITLRRAMHERYAYGRLFGASRLASCGPGRRLAYAIGAPLLPVLLLGRLTGAALRSRQQRPRFLRALPPLVVLVVSRSWGEWLAYLTGRPGRALEQPA